jgi:thiol-disulfide isomerase/thioredoxin
MLVLGLVMLLVAGQEPADTCAAHLRELGRALRAYQVDEGRLPDRLSALLPGYLPDAEMLHCPLDRTAGEPGDSEGHADRSRPTSYSYEARAEPSNGLSDPPGAPPESDLPGRPWGTERNLTLWLRRFYGDAVPIVRCYHHRAPDRSLQVRNLTLEGAVYEGTSDWKTDARAVRELAARAARELSADPAQFRAQWRLSSLDAAVRGWHGAAGSPEARMAMQELAAALTRAAGQTGDAPGAHRIAALLALHRDDFPAALAAARAALDPPDQRQNENARQLLAEALSGQGRHDAAVDVYRDMLEQNPKSGNIRSNLASELEAAGRHDEAAPLIAQIEPGRALVGQPAPEFRLPLLAGGEASPAVLLQGKKALLLNFWFHRCGPCRAEFPHLQALYDERKGQGLALLAIDNDDERDTIARYVRENGWTFPVGIGQESRTEGSVTAEYKVVLFPTNVVIGADGRIVYHGGWDETAIRAALEKLDVK